MRHLYLIGGVLFLTACSSAPTGPAPTTAPATARRLEKAPSPTAVPPSTIVSATGAAPQPSTATPTREAGPQAAPFKAELREYPVPPGKSPHDVAPAADGGVWFTAQGSGELGWLDPASGQVKLTKLGPGSAPHGVIVGPDGAAWITDGGQNAIVRVDPSTQKVDVFPLPETAGGANLNTAVFDRSGTLWFTGQSGVYGRLDPRSGKVEAWPAPRGRGPYGIAVTPDGEVYYASLAGSHIARIDTQTGQATPIEPPTRNQGARRVWADSRGRVWVSEWNSGQVSVYDPGTGAWRQWALPGRAQTYAVYVDDRDIVWLSDFGNNSLLSFDPATEQFTPYPLPSPGAAVRQINGRKGEVWGAESGASKLVLIRTK